MQKWAKRNLKGKGKRQGRKERGRQPAGISNIYQIIDYLRIFTKKKKMQMIFNPYRQSFLDQSISIFSCFEALTFKTV